MILILNAKNKVKAIYFENTYYFPKPITTKRTRAIKIDMIEVKPDFWSEMPRFDLTEAEQNRINAKSDLEILFEKYCNEHKFTPCCKCALNECDYIQFECEIFMSKLKRNDTTIYYPEDEKT